MQEAIGFYKLMFLNAFDYKGKAKLKEYWYPFLINVIISIILRFIPVVGLIISLILLIPGITLAIRRMHDAGFTPWLLFVPFYDLYCLAQPSKD